MTDRLPGSPGKYSAVVAGGELQKMQTGKPFAITLQLDDDPVREGTPYSKAAVLPDELAAKLCPETEDPAPKDAYRGLWEKKADSIRSKSGTVIAIEDSAHTPLKGLKLFGKTTQNGTPTPESPVELENIGGKNYMPKTEYTASGSGKQRYFITTADAFPTLAVGDYTLSFESTTSFFDMTVTFYAASGSIVTSKQFATEANTKTSVTITLPSEASSMALYSREVSGTITNVALNKSGDGSIGVTVAGKNLLPKAEYTTTAAANIMTEADDFQTLFPGTYTISFDCQAEEWKNMTVAFKYNGVEVWTVSLSPSPKTTHTFSLHQPVNQVVWYVREAVVITNAQLEAGGTATAYEPYKAKTLTASTPNGLPGIPVASGGNYTDESGQQWICDEIDFARGVYVQRIGQYTFTGNEVTQTYGSVNANGFCRMQILSGGAASAFKSVAICVPAVCDKYVADSANNIGTLINNGGTGYKFGYLTNGQMVFSTASTTTNAFKTEIAGTVIQYQFATPIETALSAEELEAYALLHTNKPNTTVANDAGADMEISYYTPNAAVPVVFAPKDAGKVLSIDEHGCVVLTEQKDRVVEQGVSGIWTYRKWDSGIAECWLKYTTTVGISSGSSPVWDKFYRSHTSEIPLPVVFAEMPMFNVSVFGDAPVIYDGTSYVSNSMVNMIQLKSFVRAEDTSKSYSITYCVHAIGKRK